MANNDGALTDPTINRSEHDPVESAKRVLPLTWNGTGTSKAPTPLIDLPYDYIGFTNPDGNNN